MGRRAKTHAAEAAIISCLLALVKARSTTKNKRVKDNITPMVSGLVVMVPASESL